jgi:hypothetical protein
MYSFAIHGVAEAVDDEAGDVPLHEARILVEAPGEFGRAFERGFGPVHANEPAGMPAALLQHADRQRRGVARNRHCRIDNCLERIEDLLLGVQVFGPL